MPTFDPGRVPEAQLRAALQRSAQTALKNVDIEKETLRDVRLCVEKDLGWGAFHSRERRELKRTVLDILSHRHGDAEPSLPR